MWIQTTLCVVVLSIVALYKYMTGNKNYWTKRNVYTLDMGSVVSLWKRLTFSVPFHQVDIYAYQAIKAAGVKSFAGIVEFRSPTLIVTDLDLIKAITVKDFDHFVNRRTIDMKKSDPTMDDMLVNKKGQEWKDLRSTLSPTFTTGKIKHMFDIFNQSGLKMTEFLKTEVENGSTDIDMKDAFGRYTMDVIASAAFGVESQVFKDKDSPFALSGKKLQNQFKGFKVWKLIIAIFAPKLLSFFKIKFRDEEAHAFFENVIRETINRRENSSGEKRADFLQLLLDARGGKELADESGEKLDTFEKDAQLTKATKMQLTDNLIYAQALLFFIAGFDTTESLLIFAAYELALNQDVQEKLFQEIDQVVEREEKMNYETVNHMEYLEKVVSETLRKYPPGFRTERKCTMEYKIPNSNVTLEKDVVVMIPIIGIHHDEKYFPEPEKFDPERFSPENKEKRHPYAYMPFGTGPRNCIAMRFALMEGKACLAHLVHKFKIEPSSKTMIPLKYSKSAAFKPDGGMWLKITPRS